jgi:hypothetical protein
LYEALYILFHCFKHRSDHPKITSPILPFKIIQEGSKLNIPCSASGSPMPNVTWVKVLGNTKVVMGEGLANATLKIKDINRNQSGMYECQATNIPNEVPVTTKIEVIVLAICK